jgi:energy-coupling factor transport system substrate-specific component
MRSNRLVVTATALLALALFCWPLYAGDTGLTQQGLAQATYTVLMPLLLIVLAMEFTSGGIDSRQLAVLAVLAALNGVVRMLGAGVAGIETVFFIVIIAAYVMGSSFGFLLGATSLFVSALLMGGVGPWLPFQAMAAGLVGLGAGLLPRVRLIRLWLIGYAIIASFVYGGLMTMWNWPFMAGTGTSVSYLPGAGPLANIVQFLKYEAFTGGLLWDAGRALTTSLLIWLTAPALIATLRRAATRAGFESSDKVARSKV